MPRVVANAERVINALPESVFAVLADYKNQRPRMLTPNFLDYKVEKGGIGDGTVVSYRLHSANRERAYHMRVDEAVRGQVLTERDSNSSLVTTWSVTPVNNGQSTRVRVTTEWEGGTGTKGFFERTFAPLGLRRIYNQMLDSLEQLLAGTSDAQVTRAQGQQYSPASNLRGLLLIVGLLAGFALGIRYFQKPKGAR